MANASHSFSATPLTTLRGDGILVVSHEHVILVVSHEHVATIGATDPEASRGEGDDARRACAESRAQRRLPEEARSRRSHVALVRGPRLDRDGALGDAPRDPRAATATTKEALMHNVVRLARLSDQERGAMVRRVLAHLWMPARARPASRGPRIGRVARAVRVRGVLAERVVVGV